MWMASYGWLHKLGMLLHCWTPYWNFPWFQPAFRGQGIELFLLWKCIFPKSSKLLICLFIRFFVMSFSSYKSVYNVKSVTFRNFFFLNLHC